MVTQDMSKTKMELLLKNFSKFPSLAFTEI